MNLPDGLLALALLLTAGAAAFCIMMSVWFGLQRARMIGAALSALVFAAVSMSWCLYISVSPEMSAVILAAFRPDTDAPVGIWWIARTALGEPWPLVPLFGLGLAALMAVAALWERWFVIGVTARTPRAGAADVRRTPISFRGGHRGILRKELRLLVRNPGALAQIGLQLVYFIPLAAMLWQDDAIDTATLAVVAGGLLLAAPQTAHYIAASLIGHDLVVGWIPASPVAQSDLVWAKFCASALATGAFFALPTLLLLVCYPALSVVYLPAMGCAVAVAILRALWSPQRRKRGDPAVLSPSGGSFFIGMLVTGCWAGAMGLAYLRSVWCVIPLGLAVAALIQSWHAQRADLTSPRSE